LLNWYWQGPVLYEFGTGRRVAAGISVYVVRGQEYIAVPSGSSWRDAATAGAAMLIVFSLLRGRHGGLF
jgi:hypothetical protein